MKTLWLGLVSLLLGPFALWFLYIAKLRRRNSIRGGLGRQSLIAVGLAVFSAGLFFAPVPWPFLLALYLAAGLGTTWAMSRPARIGFFPLGFQESAPAPAEGAGPYPGKPGGKVPATEAWLGAGLAAYPLVYIMALLHNIGELQSFSIHLPSDVYTDGLLWMAYATPVVAFAGFLAWKSGYRPGLRALVFFYAGVGVILGWIMAWERCDLWLSEWIPGSSREAMLFGTPFELRWRAAVKAVFYGGAFLIGIAYLAGSRRTAIFGRRAVFLGLPSLLLYFNMLFVLGDWNFILDGLREKSLEAHHYGLYRVLARAELARVPASHTAPYLIDEWADLEYQSGDVEAAKRLLVRLKERCGAKPYYGKLRKRAESQLSALGRSRGLPAVQLDLPVIKPASYLDQEWYALLSAVAFLKPGWNDMELKKRLLDLSSTIQLRLPELENVPQLIPALRQLEVPVSACFLDSERMRTALASGKVPFLSLYGKWVPVSGYDPGRDGFYYYSYVPPTGQDWLRNENTDLFYSLPGQAFGGAEEKARTRMLRLGLQKFVPRAELEAHLLDVGGVGLILGDSAFAPPGERRAALLVELGDVYYQEHENYELAADAYRRAGEAFPNLQVDSRKVYLKRRYRESVSGSPGHPDLFKDFPPDWFEKLGPGEGAERAITRKILSGGIGTYLMMNWYSVPGPDTSAATRAGMDTALALFRGLRKLDPDEPVYVDSLASLQTRMGDLAAADSLYRILVSMYPFGSESAYFRWAWIKLRLGQVNALPDLLSHCEMYSAHAKYLTMRGAVAMGRKRWRSAHSALTRSLKLDKSLGETHALLAEWYQRKGDERNMLVHRRWLRRST